jgi:hypothetical protein
MPNARSSCLVVVPAYNEAGMIEGAIGALCGKRPQLDVATGDKVRTLESCLRGGD